MAGLLFFTAHADAQSKSSTKSKAKSTKAVKAEKEADTEEKEEVEYYWAYTVLDVVGKPGNIAIQFDKSIATAELKMSPEQRDIAKKAASGGLRFKSELEFITFMADQNYELISVVNNKLASSNAPARRMYFRIQLEK